MILHAIRAIFLVVVLAVTLSFALSPEVTGQRESYVMAFILIPALSGFAMIMLDMLWKRKHLQALSGLFFGILAGMVIAYGLTLVVNMVAALLPSPPETVFPGPEPALPSYTTGADGEMVKPPAAELQAYQSRKAVYDAQLLSYREYMAHVKTVELVKLLLGLGAVFLCVSFVIQTKDDFRFVIPYVEFAKEAKGPRPMVLDTSVIIDGRIADLSEARIFESEVLVPRFILAELQGIADSDDKLKRNRGRRGLDVLNRLRGSDRVDLRIIDPHVKTVEEAHDVDAKLVALAEHLNARVLTNDYNLNKIAQLRGVDVVNINDLANALKPIFLPGERMNVKVIKPGEEPGQGVGYLDDGTMVVAEHGRDFLGKEIGIVVTSVLQTSAGRMIFGRLDAERTGPRDRQS